jgi:hypothetical protein
MRALRAADPCASDHAGRDDEVWTSGPADLRVADLPPEPGTSERIINRPGLWQRWYLSAAVVIVVVGVLAAGLAVRDHTAAPASHPGVGGASDVSPGHGTNRQRTVQAVARLLARAPILPGSHEVDQLPGFGRISGGSANPNLIDQAHFYTAAGSMSDVITYFQQHPGAGFTTDADGGVSGSHGWLGRNLTIVPTHDLPFGVSTTAYANLQLSVTVVPYHGGVAFRMDSEAIWRLDRTAAEHIPASVTGVEVLVDRRDVSPQAPNVRRLLPAADARRLAAIINLLVTVAPPGVTDCPADQGFTDTLTFTGAGRPLTAGVEVQGCGGVLVRSDGDAQPALADGPVDQTLMSMLGLPPNYGD